MSSNHFSSTSTVSALVATLALAAAAAPARAVENGAPITPFGVFDFGSGALPPPSDVATFGLRVAHYRATQLHDDAGNRSPVGLKLQVDSVGVAVVKMTSTPLLGGTYGAYAVLPYLKMSNALSIPTPVGPLNLSGKDSAQGDIQIAPVVVQWNLSPGLSANAALQLQLPTGAYDKASLITAGTNHWTVTPNAAVTWIMPSGWEVSSAFSLNFNGRNKDTDYRSGVEYQQEFALGRHEGPWTFGLGGYYYQQLTDDKRGGQDIGNRARVMALGPVVNFFELGSGWPLVWLHAYKEFGAKNRSQGTHASLRAAWSF